MFGRKKRENKRTYDKENEIPQLHASICTGETVAGFKNKNTGVFVEIMLINSNDDLIKFKELYAIEGHIEKVY